MNSVAAAVAVDLLRFVDLFVAPPRVCQFTSCCCCWCCCCCWFVFLHLILKRRFRGVVCFVWFALFIDFSVFLLCVCRVCTVAWRPASSCLAADRNGPHRTLASPWLGVCVMWQTQIPNTKPNTKPKIKNTSHNYTNKSACFVCVCCWCVFFEFCFWIRSTGLAFGKYLPRTQSKLSD